MQGVMPFIFDLTVFEMPRQYAIKLALDKIHLDPVGYEKVSGKSMPLLPKTHCQIESFEW
jgi:hypothetical protein